MMFDFSQLPVVDAHVHPFSLKREKTPYARGFCMNTFRESDNDIQYQLTYRMVLQEFKTLFNLPNETPDEEILKIRHEMANKDYKAYTKFLMDTSKIGSLFSDYGYPVTVLKGSSTLSEDEVSEFNKLMDGICDVYDVIRIETTSDRVFKPGMAYEDFIAAFDKYVDDHIKVRRTIGMKSVIGYYTGLNVKPISEVEGKKAFYAHYFVDHDNFDDNKKFRDHMFYHGMELCSKYDFPLQIHTGAGDAPMSDLRTMNPNCLYDVINTKQGMKTKMVLVHGGVPYVIEAAYLAQCYPNVYLDISEHSAYIGAFVEETLPHALDWCSLNKIVYGSDAGGLVDEAWFGTVYFKRVLAEELEKRVKRNQLTKSYAEDVAKWILSENANRIFKI